MQDNPRRRNVPIQYTPAFRAVVYSGRERLDCDGSALRASLTGPARVDGDDTNTSVFSFVFDHRPQLGPRGITNRLGEHRLSQARYIEIFNCNQGVTANQVPRKFVGKIPSLISRLGTMTREVLFCFEPAFASQLATGNRSLETTMFPKRLFSKLWRIDCFAVRCGDQAGQTNIDTDRALVGPWTVDFRNGDLETGVPFSASARYDGSTNFGIGRDAAMPLDFDLAGDANNTDVPRLSYRQAIANTKFCTTKTTFRLESRESSMPLFDPTEKGFKSLIKPPKDLLLCCKTVLDQSLVNSPNGFQFSRLLVKTEANAFASVSINSLLKCCIVQIAKALQHIRHFEDLLLIRVNSIFAGQDSHGGIITGDT